MHNKALQRTRKDRAAELRRYADDKMIEKVTVTAIAVVALSLGNALAADPPAASGRGPGLQFELVDGTVITGSTDIKAITFQTASGSVLKVPVAELTELTVGLKGRAKPQNKIRAGENTLVGTITVKTFRIASPYGLLTVKLDDIRRIRPGFRAVSVKAGQWSVQLRDKSHLRGIPTAQSLRIETRHGTMVVPLAQIWKATFAADGKTISVKCWGPDRIVGSLGPKATISFKADKGKMNISASKIAMIVACDALTFDLGKGVTMKLTLIPAGKSLMGSPKTETDRGEIEGPQREVAMSKPFYMGVYEATQAQWYAVMGTKPWRRKDHTKAGDSNAASFISWDDATEYCELLSRKTGKKVTLPTEAQWEYACRAGSKTAYSFGDDSSKLGDHAWCYKNAFEIRERYAHAVGRKKPNAFGLYDMHGNVCEWCRDYYDAKFYAKAKNIDPENTTESRFRVLRGGSWYGNPKTCRAANRFWVIPGYRNYVSGFRVVVVSALGVD